MGMIRVRCKACLEVYGLREGHLCRKRSVESVAGASSSSILASGRSAASVGPCIGLFDRKAYQREYMRGYMRRRREKEREGAG